MMMAVLRLLAPTSPTTGSTGSIISIRVLKPVHLPDIFAHQPRQKENDRHFGEL